MNYKPMERAEIVGLNLQFPFFVTLIKQLFAKKKTALNLCLFKLKENISYQKSSINIIIKGLFACLQKTDKLNFPGEY